VLYRAHHALAAAMPGTDARQDAAGRWQRAFDDIDAHRILQASDAAKGLLHPAAAKVIATLTSEWDGLARHQHLPQLPLDNNISERALRTPVIGRKNFYGSGAAWAAHLAADVWTVTATAARHDIEPLGLLTGYLLHAPATAAPPRTEPAWTRSCPGHSKDAPAVVPPAIPAGAKVPARNPGSPQSRPMPGLSCHPVGSGRVARNSAPPAHGRCLLRVLTVNDKARDLPDTGVAAGDAVIHAVPGKIGEGAGTS
jgi:hypothetical protein